MLEKEKKTNASQPVEMTPELESKMVSEAYKRHRVDGKYICDQYAPLGSIDNPVVVGIPEYSHWLYYDYQRKCWILTDGLGNGYIR
ncbi:hypothetical protein [Acetivibrio straminisolvens]|jgi:hypothetical protein|uniref:Uncharacterized protein n=1 Tax=Acetivibrio straminisolvens JCM 21531 TaxID=1294263 RepID=W4V9D5_9FIRM|nr:hypothetical protein [Acetivibrio straminisolvens]GAE89801.1 hypothetical protein JCM21531_3364 [Acetivibrio straminisolvens JCM 21531]